MAAHAHFPETFTTPLVVHPDDLPGKFSLPVRRLNNQGIDVVFGIHERDVPAITEIALQPSTREYCPNDEQRWGDVERTRAQLAKAGGRAVMRLVDREDGMTLGFGWTGAMSDDERRHLPWCQNTFAIRMHEAAQGRHLALPFTQSIVAATMSFCHARRIGLSTWGSNRPAGRTYLKAGANLIDMQLEARPTMQPNKRGTGIFLKNGKPHVNDVRLYMQYPWSF